MPSGTFHFQDPYLSVNSVDLSDHVRSVTLTYNAEELDDTAGGDTHRSRIGGMKDWSLQVEFNQDFAAAKVDATIFSLVGTTTAIEVRPDTDAVSATNPKFTGNVLVTEYSPLANGVGELATTSATWPGSGALTRATA